MIIEYDENGYIFHLVYEPYSESMIDVMNEAGCKFIIQTGEEISPSTHYVKDDSVIERPIVTTEVTLDGYVIKVNTDSPIVVEIEGERIDIDGNSFEVDEPGEIVLYVNHSWPIIQEVINLEIS